MTTPREGQFQASGSGLFSRVFVVLCLIHLLYSFVTSPFIVALFPVYVEADLDRLPWFTGYLRGLFLLLGGVFAAVSGWVCDLLSRKTVLLIGLGGAVLTGVVFRTTDPFALSALMFVVGAAMGPWVAASQSYLITSVDARRLGLGGALFFLSKNVGDALGSLVAGVLKESWTFPQIGTAMVAGMTFVFVLAVLLLPNRQGRAAPQADRPRLALWSAYRPLLRQRNVHLLVSLRYLITTFWGMAALVMPLLIFRTSGSASTAAYYAFVSLAVAVATQPLVGLLCDRFGRLWPLLVSAGGFVLSGLVLALFWQSLVGLFIFGTALTVTAWAVSVLIPKLMNDVAAPDEKSRLVGLTHMAWSLAMVTGSILGGILVELHPSVPFCLGAALAAGGTACAWRLCLRLDRQGR